MNVDNRIVIKFANLKIEFVFPSQVNVPEELSVFRVEASEEPDIVFGVQLLESPIQVSDKPFAKYRGLKIYQRSDGWLRVYSELTAEDGCQVACLLEKSGKNVLYYPASKWEHYSQEIHLLHLLGIEEILLEYEALLLHSSIVQLHDQVVLFSGPSCVGKSTQASLWKEYLGAEILNGDRCIIRKIEKVFYGCGSPWAGTSGIYRKEMFPIKGIFILQQAKENTVRSLKREAFVKLYQQCIVHSWDEEFTKKISDLLIELLEQIPVYELSCRPDKEAVELAYRTLFEGGRSGGEKDKCKYPSYIDTEVC